MSQRDDTGFKSFVAGEAIPLYSRVFLESDGTITLCTLAEKSIGTLQTKPALAAGDIVPVKLRTASGTHKVRVKEAVAIGAALYGETAGEYQDTAEATSFLEMQALEAATAEDDIIEAMYMTATGAAAQ
jgi:hypothetical protein